MARLPQENAPGIPLTGLAPDARRAQDYALLRQNNKALDALDARASAIESARDDAALAGDLRRHSRSIQDTDALAIRTLRPGDLLISLEGGAGTLVMHSASERARVDFVCIRNNSSVAWQMDVADPGTETVNLNDTPMTSQTIGAGEKYMLWNRTPARWEAY